jgi:hypothetical protein
MAYQANAKDNRVQAAGLVGAGSALLQWQEKVQEPVMWPSQVALAAASPPHVVRLAVG